jgi:spore maturation protein CgeB
VRIVIFCHSLISDWNHGNAHFLRGVSSELLALGHEVRVYEPENAWSVVNLIAEHGHAPLEGFSSAYPELSSTRYVPNELDLDSVLEKADVVLVHEWNDPDLVAAIGAMRTHGRYVLLFHDTHHRSVTKPDELARYDLRQYDGVLAFGDPVRDAYLQNTWTRRAWTWHEAADVRRFHPRPADRMDGDLVWIGNWGDEERTAELHEFLIEPVRRLGVRARVYGVRYPASARAALADAGIEYGGWLPNYAVAEVFSRFRLTIHVPRAPYVSVLPGIPTIRPFEALACGIPLIVALWDTSESLFTSGEDFLFARTGREMACQIERLLGDAELRERLVCHGLKTILSRHTCAHRVDELLAIVDEIRHEADAFPRRELQDEAGAPTGSPHQTIAADARPHVSPSLAHGTTA